LLFKELRYLIDLTVMGDMGGGLKPELESGFEKKLEFF